MSPSWRRWFLLAAGRHRKQATEGEIRRAAEVLASWKEIGIWGI